MELILVMWQIVTVLQSSLLQVKVVLFLQACSWLFRLIYNTAIQFSLRSQRQTSSETHQPQLVEMAQFFWQPQIHPLAFQTYRSLHRVRKLELLGNRALWMEVLQFSITQSCGTTQLVNLAFSQAKLLQLLTQQPESRQVWPTRSWSRLEMSMVCLWILCQLAFYQLRHPTHLLPQPPDSVALTWLSIGLHRAVVARASTATKSGYKHQIQPSSSRV